MNQRVMRGIVFAVIILGVIGIVSNPFWLIRQLAFIALIGGIIYFAYRFFMRKRMGKEYSSYLKAAKQSKRRFNEPKNSGSNVRSFTQVRRTSKASAMKKKKQPSHLTVIEGKKGKKKNRAHF